MKPGPPGDPLDALAIRRALDRASASFVQHAAVHREVAARLTERLQVVRLAPRRLLDLGCAAGLSWPGLGARFPEAMIVGTELSAKMLHAATGRAGPPGRMPAWLARLAPGGSRRPHAVAASPERLPFANASFDLVFSNLALGAAGNLPAVFDEVRRVLAVDGLFMFTTPGPDSLRELRRAFDQPSLSPGLKPGFADMHDIGDLLVGSGFADPVMDVEHLRLVYRSPEQLFREMRMLGVRNAVRGRRAGLAGRALRETAGAALPRDAQGNVVVTLEVVYGHAWRVAAKVAEDGRAIVRFSPRRPPPAAGGER